MVRAAIGSDKAPAFVVGVGEIVELLENEAPPFTRICVDVTCAPPPTTRAVLLFEFRYMPQLAVTLTLPLALTAPDALGSRLYTHAPEGVTVTPAVAVARIFRDAM